MLLQKRNKRCENRIKFIPSSIISHKCTTLTTQLQSLKILAAWKSLLTIKYSACVIWLPKAYSMCNLLPVSKKIYHNTFIYQGAVNIMINHQFLEICYSMLFDQESEKT